MWGAIIGDIAGSTYEYKQKDKVEPVKVDEIIKEPTGGAHYNIEEMANNLKEALVKSLEEFKGQTGEELKNNRYSKFRRMGVFAQ